MRTATIVGAALFAVALALYPLTLVADPYPLLLLGVLATVAFALALLSAEWILAGPAMGILMGEYAIALRSAELSIDELIPAMAVAALVLMEMIDLTGLLGRHPRPEKEVVKNRVRHIVATALMAGAVSTAVLLAARVIQGGPAQLIVPAAAAGLIALVVAGTLAQRAVEGS